MTNKDTLNLNIHNRFSFRDRMRILMGYQMVNIVAVEVEATATAEKVAINFGSMNMKTWLGKPKQEMTSQPQLTDKTDNELQN